MRLSDEDLVRFADDGYLFLPETFTPAEVAVLRREVPGIFAQERDEVWRERDGKAVRTAFAAHSYNEAFRRLAAHPRMIEPVQQILDGPVYVHQFKINGKQAFDGDVWQWHQDYGTWARDDEMPEPRAMNIAVFLDDVTEFNGALMFIPGSHNSGILAAGHDLETTSYPLWTLDHETIRKMADARGIIAPKGPAGSILLFHGNLVHASPGNTSPWDRTIVYVSLCHVENHIRRFKRPAWIAHRDFAPIRCLPDACLLELAVRAAE